MSGLRSSCRIRAQRLAEKVRRREIQENRKGLTAPELAWEQALELAPAREIEELDRLESPRIAAADDGDAEWLQSLGSSSSCAGTGSARLMPSRMRAVSSRTISMTRCIRHLSSLTQ